MSKYSKQFKRTVIIAFLDRGIGFRHIADQFQVDPTLLRRWVAAYQLHGEASLKRRMGIAHAPEFKLSVLQRMWHDQLSFRQTAALFNLGNSTQVGIWEKHYYSGGFEALMSGKNGLCTDMPLQPTEPSEAPSKNDEDLSRAELLAKLRKLQVENAWLKKLKEYREEKKRQQKATKKKPG